MNEATLLERARSRQPVGRTRPDRVSAVVLGGSFFATSFCWLAVERPDVPYITLTMVVALHAIASSIELDIGPGSVVPTTPVLVVGFFLLPSPLLPLAVFGGLALSSLLARLLRRERSESVMVIAVSAWHAFGPAIVSSSFGLHHSRPYLVVLVTMAIFAQILFDTVATVIRNCMGLGVSVRDLLPSVSFTAWIDVLLAPLGLAAAWAMPNSPAALLLVIPLVGLMGVVQRDRRRFLDHAVVLNDAYTSTSRRARVDPLTGLANRLAWDEAIETLSRSPHPIGVLALDVDGLKVANDRFGHETGDRLIAAVGEVARAATADVPGAVVARLGGDEFGALLPGVDSAELERLGALVRGGLGRATLLEGAIPVSASIGYALSTKGAVLHDTIAAADQAAMADKVARGVHRR